MVGTVRVGDEWLAPTRTLVDLEQNTATVVATVVRVLKYEILVASLPACTIAV